MALAALFLAVRTPAAALAVLPPALLDCTCLVTELRTSSMYSCFASVSSRLPRFDHASRFSRSSSLAKRGSSFFLDAGP